jgi:hypothetical protein
MYTVLDAAAELKLDPSHVRLLLRTGRLKGTKHGRDWMIPALDYRKKRTRRKSAPAPADPSGSDIFRLLKEAPVLSGVSDAELSSLAAGGIRLHFQKQQTVVMEEDKAEFCYFIVSGMIKIFKAAPPDGSLLLIFWTGEKYSASVLSSAAISILMESRPSRILTSSQYLKIPSCPLPTVILP